MNIKSTFEALFNPQQLSVAKVISDVGGGKFDCLTQNGHPLLLRGTATVGQMVFYDMRTSTIIGQAPDISMIDIPV